MPIIRYSVIIPHKDIPDLLDRLLRSIPKREDIEVFVVDDNSDPKIMAGYKEMENVNYRYTRESLKCRYIVAMRQNRYLREHGLFRYHKQPPQQKEPYITYLKKEDD